MFTFETRCLCTAAEKSMHLKSLSTHPVARQGLKNKDAILSKSLERWREEQNPPNNMKFK